MTDPLRDTPEKIWAWPKNGWSIIGASTSNSTTQRSSHICYIRLDKYDVAMVSIDALQSFIDDAFEAYPNLDIEVDAIRDLKTKETK